MSRAITLENLNTVYQNLDNKVSKAFNIKGVKTWEELKSLNTSNPVKKGDLYTVTEDILGNKNVNYVCKKEISTSVIITDDNYSEYWEGILAVGVIGPESFPSTLEVTAVYDDDTSTTFKMYGTEGNTVANATWLGDGEGGEPTEEGFVYIGGVKVPLNQETSTDIFPNKIKFTNTGNAVTINDETITVDSTQAALQVVGGAHFGSDVYTVGRTFSAVWNDLVDSISVDEDCILEFGKVYCFNGEHYKQSSEYLNDGIIGIHSDTYGYKLGSKLGKELNCAVAGFVLAYVDKEYPVGTPLTATCCGMLTEIHKQDKMEYPEKIVATYWKDEPNEYWGPENNKVKVNGRKWVKVR